MDYAFDLVRVGPEIVIALLTSSALGIVGAGLGWLIAPLVTMLADGHEWPRKHASLLTGLLFAGHALIRYPGLGLSAGAAVVSMPLFALELLVLGCLLAAVQVDLKIRIIPNEIVLSVLGAGVIRALIAPAGFSSQIAGFVLVGAIMLVVGIAGRGALGAGDVKLLAAAGLFLGWWAGLLAFLMSFACAGVAAIILMFMGSRGRRRMLPFAPFLSAGIWSAMLLSGPALALLLSFISP